MSLNGRLGLLMHRLRRAAAPADGASDASLLDRFVAVRDEAAFELLVWRYGPMVLSVCRRMLHCDQDAEDAFQAAFLLLARKAASIRRRAALAGWLYQTACRVALRARAAACKQPVAVPRGVEPAAPSVEPDVVWRDLRPVLDEEVGRLPERYRLAIILCYFQGRTHAQAARELGCPRGTVAVRLHRAKELLRRRLTRRGLALSAAALALLTAERTASAAVPAALVHTVVKAAVLFAAGKAVAGVASAKAVAWTQGVLRTMFFSKMKLVVAVAAAVAVVATGTGLLMSRGAAPPRTQAAVEAPPTRGQADDEKGLTDAPSEREGRLALVGTEIKPGETIPAKERATVEVGFLAVELGDKSDPKLDKIAPEKWWAGLDAGGAKVFARWKEGDPLPPGKLFVAREEREYRKLHVGDAVEEGQLLAIVDEGPALDDLAAKTDAQESAEAEYLTSVKTKEEAIRRADQAEFLWSKGQGYISKDDYEAALLNRDRYLGEVLVKDVARRHTGREVIAAVHALKACEVRSDDQGVVMAILKRRGEAVHAWEPIVRLEVKGAPAAPPDKPSAKPADAPAASVVSVPAQREGVLLVVGTEIQEGDKVSADEVVTVKVNGQVAKYRRLRVGEVVQEGQLLARLDDRLARLDVEQQMAKVQAAEASLDAAAKIKDAAAQREQSLSKLGAAVSQEELRAGKLDVDRAAADVQIKAADLHQAQAALKAAQTILEMYEIRSPVSGVVRAVHRDRGEAVRSLDTVVEVEEKVKP